MLGNTLWGKADLQHEKLKLKDRRGRHLRFTAGYLSAVYRGENMRETTSPRTQFEREKQEAKKHVPTLEASSNSSPQTSFSVHSY